MNRAKHAMENGERAAGVVKTAVLSLSLAFAMPCDLLATDYWIYDSVAKTMTDGNFTVEVPTFDAEAGSVTVSFNSITSTTAGCLDLSLPVYDSEDADRATPCYVTATQAESNGVCLYTSPGVTSVRFGPSFMTLGQLNFAYRSNCLHLYGLSATRLTQLPSFYYCPGQGTYECAEFFPTNLVSIGAVESAAHYCTRTYVGTLVLTNLTSLADTSFGGRITCSGITNVVLSNPGLTSLGSTSLSKMKLQSLTLGGTNYGKIASDSLTSSATTLKDVIFLRDAPSMAIMDGFMAPIAAADGAKQVTVNAPMSLGFYQFIEGFTAAEVAAEKPAGAVGAYVTSSGARKAWMVNTETDGTFATRGLIMRRDLLPGEAVYTGGFASGDTTNVTVAGEYMLNGVGYGTAGYVVEELGANGFTETARGTGATYAHTHQGVTTRVTFLSESVMFTVEVIQAASNYYSSVTWTPEGVIQPKGTSVTLTAVDRTEPPVSKFVRWRGAIGENDPVSRTITVLAENVAQCEPVWEPMGWLYSPGAKTVTDGFWVFPATRDAMTGDYSVGTPSTWGWELDLSLPVCPADASVTNYVYDLYGQFNYSVSGYLPFRRIVFGPHVRSISVSPYLFNSNDGLRQIEGLSRSAITVLNKPLFRRTSNVNPMDCADFFPSNLVQVTAGLSVYNDGSMPIFSGSLVLTNLEYATEMLNQDKRVDGITNVVFAAPRLTGIGVNITKFMKNLESLTLGGTNITAFGAGELANAKDKLRTIDFLAYPPPERAVLDRMLDENTGVTTAAKPLVILGSKYLRRHGGEKVVWRDLASAMTAEERAVRPEGAWGICETASEKRFYLVHRVTEYDAKPATVLMLQ